MNDSSELAALVFYIGACLLAGSIYHAELGLSTPWLGAFLAFSLSGFAFFFVIRPALKLVFGPEYD